MFFGNVPRGTKKELTFKDEIEASLFNEWFVYDFKFKNGATPLEDFYQRNPENLDDKDLEVYKTLQENRYSFFKVEKNILGEGLVLKDITTGKVYQVREYAATFHLKEGQVFPTRVAKVIDHYEMVGSPPPIPPVTLSPQFEAELRRTKNWSPKKIWRIFLKDIKEDTFSEFEEYPTLTEAEEKMNQVLAKHGLGDVLTAELIKEWIFSNEEEGVGFNVLNLIISLLRYDKKDYIDALQEITDSFLLLYTLCPQKALGGKSPYEMHRDLILEKGVLPDLKFSISKPPHFLLFKKFERVHQYAKQNDYEKTLETIDDIFEYMLTHKICCPEIYRLYLNKGAYHLFLNEVEEGVLFLEIAQEINPYYDLPQKNLEIVKNSNVQLDEEVIENVKKEDIGYKYYQFLKSLKINFAQKVED